jgi:hypothetical protein
MLLWTVLMVSIGVLATLMVITASANPPNAAEMRLQGLVNELREDRLTAERHSAQLELEAAGDAAVPALTVALRSTDSTMRRNAADMLGFIASPSSIGALENALKDDPVPSVRRNAAWALGNISGLSALGELERATVLDSSAIVRQTALDSVARVRSRLALSAGIDERDLTAFAVSPQNSDIVYAATKRDLLVTQNGGTSWSKLANTLPSLTNVLAISPADVQTIYAGVDGLGMFKSVDGGKVWRPINTGLDVTPGARFLITDVTIDPINPQRVVISTGIMLGTSNVDFYPTGLRLSTDGGKTWHVMEGNTPDEPLTQLALEGNQVYALAGDQVLVYQLD